MPFRRQGPLLFLQFLESHSGILQDVVEQLLHGFPAQVRIEPAGQLKIDFHIRLAALHGNGFVDGLQRNPPAPDAVLFKKRGGGKNDIRKLRCGSHEQVDRRDKIELLESFAPLLRFKTDSGDQVAGLHPDGFDRVGFSAENLIQDRIGLSPPDEFSERAVFVGADPLADPLLWMRA